MSSERKITPEYVQLHTHSKYSFLSDIAAIPDPEQIVSTMKKKGHKYASLTDRENFYGFARFMRACEAEGMKPIPGIELPVDPGFGRNPEYITILPQTNEGIQKLFSLTSKVKRDGQILTLDDLADQSETAIIITRGDYVPFRELLREADTIFWGIDSPKYPIQNEAEKVETATKKTVVFHETRMAHPEELTAMRFLLKVVEADNVTFQTNSLLNFTIKSPIEIESLYKRHPNALGRTREIAESINVTLPRPKPVKAKDIPSRYTSNEYLRYLVEAEMRRRELPPSLRTKVEEEIAIIEDKDFSDYLLITRDIAEFCKNKGIPFRTDNLDNALSRRYMGIPHMVYGSGNNSMVLNLLDVSSVDASDLDSTRFINPDRDDLPDVDTDHPYDRKEEVEQYVLNKYDDATFLSVVNHLKRKGVIQLARRHAIRITNEEIDAVVKANIPNTSSKHASGITFFENAPQIRIQGKDLAMADKTDIDKIYGIAKLDILGKSALTRIARIQDMLRERGMSREIFDNDPDTLRKIFSGDTLGITNIDSPHIQNILRKIGRMEENPGLEEITQVLAVARPETLIRNRFYDYSGKELTILRGFPDIERITGKTNYTLIYQEQAMQVVTQLAGLPQKSAERLKKMMSDGLSAEERTELIGSIRIGLQKNGYPENIQDELITQLEAFTGYVFVEGHSRALARVAYDLGYYATHHPEFYWTAVMTTVAEKQTGLPYPPQTYVNEMLRKGLTFSFPDTESLRNLPYFQDGKIVVGKKLFTGKNEDITPDEKQERKPLDIKRYNELLTIIRDPNISPQKRIRHQLRYFGTCFTENPINMFPSVTHFDPGREQQWIVGQKQTEKKLYGKKTGRVEQLLITFDTNERLNISVPAELMRRKPVAFRKNLWFVRISDDMTVFDAKPLFEANKLW